MADRSHIEWTDATWNVAIGCEKVSPGCDHCYAIRTAHRMQGNSNPKVSGPYAGTESANEWTGRVNLVADRLTLPLRWKRPRRIFVNAQSDLFHDSVPDEYIARVFSVMACTPRHTFQVLTKRHARMRSLVGSDSFRAAVHASIREHWSQEAALQVWTRGWPLMNVWLGVSAENQQWADIRIPALLDTPAAVRFVSAEPLLGPIDLANVGGRNVLTGEGNRVALTTLRSPRETHILTPPCIDWVIVGGESGRNARPMHPDWARGLRDQCQAAGVAFLFKQRGEWTWNEPGQFRLPSKPFTNRVAVMHGAGMTAMTKDNPFDPFEHGHPHWTTRIERVGKLRAGRELDGRTWDEYPEVVS